VSGEGQTRWWEGAVLYQVYVRSFADSNGDGYGDLAGIIGRLDYLSWLGADGIWLSPTMPSPDEDWGYDVADYRSVHPQLGTLADLDKLVTEAGRRGIRVLLDLVPNHTSSAHPWFTAARSGRDSPYRDYYVWADPAAGGGPPNNWLDATGASAWTLDEASGQDYLHNFLPSQPDLNWWNPAVHAEFEQILRYWFDRGVAGFRIDVAHALYKDALLRDNPPADASIHPRMAGHGLNPVYNYNRPETHEVYRRWRRIAESYTPARLLLGETWVFPVERMVPYYGDDDELQLAFNFPFLFSELPDLPEAVARTMAALPPRACPVWTGSNHDVPRLASRWADGDERKTRLALLILLTLPGTTTLYYGDEIGMTNSDVPPELQRDEMSRHSDHWRGSRDCARTPMQWSPEPGAGFSRPEITPWLPFGDYQRVNVAAQRDQPGSVLTLVRGLIELRRAELSGNATSYQQLATEPWTYRAGSLMVAANLSDSPVPTPPGEVLISSDGQPGDGVLAPWQGVVVKSP
jgi:alpha-glucosidase